MDGPPDPAGRAASFERGRIMELFGFTIPTALFWVIVAVVIIAIILVIAIPIYKGYKKEMEKPAKKSGSKKGSSSKKR